MLCMVTRNPTIKTFMALGILPPNSWVSTKPATMSLPIILKIVVVRQIAADVYHE